VGTLPAAVEAVQTMGRAQGAALFFADDEGLTLRVSTMEPSRVSAVAELCADVAQAGYVRSGAVAAGHDAPIDKMAFTAIPLHYDTRLIGVLYLEGLADTSPRVEALVRRCAQLVARMLGHAASLSRWSTPLRDWKAGAPMTPDRP
jgi:hypothetical protein